jgi:hypothetical protein
MTADKPNAALDTLLDPLARCLTPESARRLVELRAGPEAQAKIDALAQASNEGRLTASERAEYEAFVAASGFIAILQSKARALLANAAGA